MFSIPWISQIITSLFSVPELKWLRLSISDVGNFPAWPNVVARKLVSLDLHQCPLTDRSLDCVMASAPNLKSLRVDLQCKWRPALESNFVDSAKLSHALSEVHNVQGGYDRFSNDLIPDGIKAITFEMNLGVFVGCFRLAPVLEAYMIKHLRGGRYTSLLTKVVVNGPCSIGETCYCNPVQYPTPQQASAQEKRMWRKCVCFAEELESNWLGM